MKSTHTLKKQKQKVEGIIEEEKKKNHMVWLVVTLKFLFFFHKKAWSSLTCHVEVIKKIVIVGHKMRRWLEGSYRILMKIAIIVHVYRIILLKMHILWKLKIKLFKWIIFLSGMITLFSFLFFTLAWQVKRTLSCLSIFLKLGR